MTLPKVHASHETVDVGGSLFDLRVITRSEAARFDRMLRDDAPKDDLEVAVIAAATDTPPAEVRDWYDQTPSWAVEELIVHIKRISRLFDVAEEAQKSGGAGDSAGGG